MTRQDQPGTSSDWLWAGSPNGGIVLENYARELISADLAALTSGIMFSVGIAIAPGEPVTSIHWLSGATAAGTPTNYWSALFDPDGALIAQSPDEGSAAWAADTPKGFTLSTRFGGGAGGIYYAALVVAATTPPTLMGRSVDRVGASDAIAPGQKVLAQTSGSGLTDTAPGTIVTPSTVADVPYVALR